MYYFKFTIATLLAVVCWLAIVLVGAFYGWWMRPIADTGDSEQFFRKASDLLNAESRGNSALVLIEDGQVVREFYSNSADPIDRDSVFSTASMSKWFTANGVMKLIEEGRADLDVPISQYLTRWQLPPSDFDNDAVTIRRLLSHTAGLADGLGFGDYEADERIPSLEESLTNPRASSEREVKIEVANPPGLEFRYSGGGYLLLELLVEEISGQSFQDYMQESIFLPLDMTRSGYGYLADMGNNAGSYARDGSAVPIYKYASKAATAFLTTPADLSKFVLSQITALSRENPTKNSSLRAMREPHGHALGLDIWGLGTILYAPTPSGDSVFGHDGANDPAINSAARINPDTSDAIIVLVTGHPSLATNIGSQWVLWETGYPDALDADAVISSMYIPGLIGLVVLLLIAFHFWYRRRTRLRTS